MHSALNRLQNVFGFFTTVAFFTAAFVALSSLTFPQAPKAKLAMKNVQVVKGRPHYYSQKREEYAHIKFDLDMDLSSLYNWNTKQVFVWIEASYPPNNPSDPYTQAIIWDAIIPSYSEPWHHNQYIHFKPSPSTSNSKSSSSSKRASTKKSKVEHNKDATPGILKLKSQRPKYQITDATGKIADRANATLTLGWNVQPWVGPLWWTNTNTYGLWKGIKGGKSKAFDLPALKSKDAQSTGKEDLKTAKGAEAYRLHVG